MKMTSYRFSSNLMLIHIHTCIEFIREDMLDVVAKYDFKQPPKFRTHAVEIWFDVNDTLQLTETT